MATPDRVSYARLQRDATVRQADALERIAVALEYFVGAHKMEHPELKVAEPDPVPEPAPEPVPEPEPAKESADG